MLLMNTDNKLHYYTGGSTQHTTFHFLTATGTLGVMLSRDLTRVAVCTCRCVASQCMPLS
jgi:hypothetical protein